MVHVILLRVCFEKSSVRFGVPRNGLSQSPLPAMGKPGNIGTEL